MAFAGSAAAWLESCSSLPIYKTTLQKNTMLVPAVQLLQVNPFLLVRENSLEYDVLIVKKNNGYQAMYLQCTHENNPLMVGEKKITCAAHGSEFSLDGEVLKGPADKPLKHFETKIIDNNLVINIKS